MKDIDIVYIFKRSVFTLQMTTAVWMVILSTFVLFFEKKHGPMQPNLVGMFLELSSKN